MIRKIFGILLFNSVYSLLVGQTVSFSKDIVPIVSTRCAPCHHKNGGVPFSLTNYTDIQKQLLLIKYVVDKRIMPPWKPTNDSLFMDSRKLTEKEIITINQWLNEGSISDISSNKQISYRKIHSESLGKPDIILKHNKPHKINGNNREEFVSYIFNPILDDKIEVRAIVIKPSNTKLTHHSRLDIDTFGLFNSISNGRNEINTLTIDNEWEQLMQAIGFYLPGLYSIKYPKNTCIIVRPGNTLVLDVHYGPSNKEEYDNPEVWLYLKKDKQPVREIQTLQMVMSDRLLVIPKDSLLILNYDCLPIETDYTITSIQAHMHLIGKSFRADLISSDKRDTMLLINIPDWDFNWQEFYFLKKPIIVKKGSHIRFTALYDNTTNNPRNPFYPPRDINFRNMETTNEMLSMFLQGFPYLKGDENIDLEEAYK